MPPRTPDLPAPGEVLAPHYGKCFGCGADHPSGLHVQSTAGEGMTLRAVFQVGEWHQGAPGLAHGGVLTAAVDDALGYLNRLLSTPAVTARLETEFVRPVPVGATLVLDAEILGVAGRKVYVAAIGRLGEDGPVALRASALFIQVQMGHFRRNGRREDVEAFAAQGPTGLWAELNP